MRNSLQSHGSSPGIVAPDTGERALP